MEKCMVLWMEGLFNPVHMMHIQAFVEARDWMEKNTEYRIKAGYIALATDAEVRRIPSTDGFMFSYKDRVHLCKLAIDGHEWIKVVDDEAYEFDLQRPEVTVGYLYGASRATFYTANLLPTVVDAVTIVVGMKGQCKDVQRIFEENEGRFYQGEIFYVPVKLDCVKSEYIRIQLKECLTSSPGLTAKLLTSLRDRGWLNTAIADYLFDSFQDLLKDVRTLQPPRSIQDEAVCRTDSGVVLYYYGCFNPVHCMHVQALVRAIRWLEGNTRYKVESAYFVLADDKSVKKKSPKAGDIWIPFTHRKKICELMIESYRWIKVFPSVAMSHEHGWAQLREYLNQPSVKIGCVLGSDRGFYKGKLIKITGKKQTFGILIGRASMSYSERKLYRQMRRFYVQNKVYVVPDILDNVSSSDIRKILKKSTHASEERRAEMLRGIVENGWMGPLAAKYLQEHFNSVCKVASS